MKQEPREPDYDPYSPPRDSSPSRSLRSNPRRNPVTGATGAPCNYEANPRYCTFANSWSTPCREHSTCLYLCTVLLLRLVHET